MSIPDDPLAHAPVSAPVVDETEPISRFSVRSLYPGGGAVLAVGGVKEDVQPGLGADIVAAPCGVPHAVPQVTQLHPRRVIPHHHAHTGGRHQATLACEQVDTRSCLMMMMMMMMMMRMMMMSLPWLAGLPLWVS
jgi:hypothetical protein